MKKLQQKVAILNALNQKLDALSLKELLIVLGPDFAERSVRRWLNEMITENVITKSGQKRSTVYRAVKSTTVKTNLKNSFQFNVKSNKSLSYLHRPLFERKPVTYNENWLNNYHPNQTYYLSAAQRKQCQELSHPKLKKSPAGTYARQIYNRLLIDLSYNSSRLEGNTYSLLDTEKLLLEGIDNKTKLDEEKIMILNHKEAIRYLVDNIARFKIDYDQICTLHYLLADGLVPARQAGKMRDHAVRIGNSTYWPLENSAKLSSVLKNICHIATQINDPHEQSFFLLTHIAYLQAFADVNKRTSRLSANIPLIQQNLYPLSFNDLEKDDYIIAMISIYELNDVRLLTELYVYSYLRTCEQYDAIAESIGVDEIRVRFRAERRNIIRQIITNKLSSKKIDTFVQQQIKQVIPKKYHPEFINDLKEDLAELSVQRIAGLDVTRAQLQAWLKLKKER